MLQFRNITVEDKKLYLEYSKDNSPRGCEMSFANLFMWGDQKIAEKDGHLFFLSKFYDHVFYPFPYGHGDKKQAIDLIIADAKERNTPCVISAVCENEKQTLESLFPDKFEFTTSDASYDYVYDINDLADLKGRKYHKKRNHLYHFQKAHPDYSVSPVNKDNVLAVKQFVDGWYTQKDDGTGEFDYEKVVFDRAMDNYEGLGLIGLMLLVEGKVVAVTFASHFTPDTLDVHFEKATVGIDGAYTAINYEFARYVRENYPDVKFLDREEDMGLAGLRHAKKSYYPHHQVVKYKATLKSED